MNNLTEANISLENKLPEDKATLNVQLKKNSEMNELILDIENKMKISETQQNDKMKNLELESEQIKCKHQENMNTINSKIADLTEKKKESEIKKNSLKMQSEKIEEDFNKQMNQICAEDKEFTEKTIIRIHMMEQLLEYESLVKTLDSEKNICLQNQQKKKEVYVFFFIIFQLYQFLRH